MAFCKCGCGKPVNPGRMYVHGHNTKKPVIVKHAPHPLALKLKKSTKPKLAPRRKDFGDGVRVLIKLLQNRQKKTEKVILALRDIE